jgi:hypothetical protein
MLVVVATLMFGSVPMLASPPTLDPTYGFPLPSSVSTKGQPVLASSWIWASQTSDNQTVLFRKTAHVPNVPKTALLYVTCDDFFTLFVNGAQVAQSVPDPADNNVWQHVHAVDVTHTLKAGDNVIAVRGHNVSSAAGLIASLKTDGKTITSTDSTWKVIDGTTEPDGWTNTGFNDAAWAAATVEAPVTGGIWSGNLNGWPGLPLSPAYLAHVTLRPVAITEAHPGLGTITGAESLLGKHKESIAVTPAAAGAADPPYIVLDFGKEMAGRIQIAGTTGAVATVQTGESKEECLKSPWHGPSNLTLQTGTLAYSPYSAFRFAKITFTGSSPITLTQCDLDDKYYPVRYLGSFDCSDPLLTKIWYTGAYTSHLCMQEDIWDAPKRDRARWVGDLHVSGEVIEDAFLDKFLMEQTMTRLRNDAQGGKPDTELPNDHVNNIPGYSAAWIGVLDEIYLHTGDIAYIRSQHNLLIGELEYMRQDLDANNLFANTHGKWPFVDWSPDFNGDSPQARAATQMFYVYAFKTASYLLREIGDSENADKYAQVARDMTAAAQRSLLSTDTNTFGLRRQENAMAIYSGVATPEQDVAIYKSVLNLSSDSWNTMASPYYNNYVIYAMSQIGHTDDAVKFIRSYWGGMIAEGATTFWEAYDLSWPKDDFHSHLQADNGTGYFVSLCHGWSSGCTAFLTDRVLGVRSTGGGFKTAMIAPDLGDLKWAVGDVPTPNGKIHVRVDKIDSAEIIALALPAKIAATIAGKGTKITINGKAAHVAQAGDKAFVTVSSPGNYRIVVR